ncbi:precorrin-8X methylmutase [Clostridium sp. AM58-1XD]|uniref:precorrin-8X methylmutase n=1 Tax=Clostridium sp. AM58-1XD TaxID=2292307 RepID=UPI00241DBF17|nr:precorrin-8X methylmutase [Clostridium sp. AM58-1XD]
MLPQEIEAKSMEIIEHEMKTRGIPARPEEEMAVVKRCIHTSADFDYGENLIFSSDAVKKGTEALKQGVTIVTDTNMAAAGINKQAAGKLGVKIMCFMADEDVAEEAKRRQTTRAAISMEKAAALGEPVIIACGNAPTALICIDEMRKSGRMRDDFLRLVIGVPVGFVNVVEAKELILESGVPSIVARGRKGGSTIAAAICNALLYQCVKR